MSSGPKFVVTQIRYAMDFSYRRRTGTDRRMREISSPWRSVAVLERVRLTWVRAVSTEILNSAAISSTLRPRASLPATRASAGVKGNSSHSTGTSSSGESTESITRMLAAGRETPGQAPESFAGIRIKRYGSAPDGRVTVTRRHVGVEHAAFGVCQEECVRTSIEVTGQQRELAPQRSQFSMQQSGPLEVRHERAQDCFFPFSERTLAGAAHSRYDGLPPLSRENGSAHSVNGASRRIKLAEGGARFHLFPRTEIGAGFHSAFRRARAGDPPRICGGVRLKIQSHIFVGPPIPTVHGKPVIRGVPQSQRAGLATNGADESLQKHLPAR